VNKDDAYALDKAHDRIAEIGDILALGLMRLLARKSSQASEKEREFSLDFVGQQSGHGNCETERIGR
jgi:hypothetical protein